MVVANISLPNGYTLIKFLRYNKVNLATLAFGVTLAQTKREVKQVEQVLILAKDFQQICWIPGNISMRFII